MKHFLHIEHMPICLIRCGSRKGVFLIRGYTGFGSQTHKHPNSIKKWYKKHQEMCLDILRQTFN